MTQLSRRFFLQGLGACTAALSTAALQTKLITNAHAAGGVGSNGNVLLVINLAGGMDSYAILQRDFGTLAAVRPTLFRNMSNPGLILPLTGTMGVHSSLSVLKQEWDLGNVSILNKLGYNNISRSHADAELAYARGVADRKSGINTGWISRLGARYFSGTPFAVWDFSGGHETNRGPYRASIVDNMDYYGFETDWQSGGNENDFRLDTVASLLRDWPGLKDDQVESQAAWTSVEQAVATIEALPAVTGYPDTHIGRQLRDFDRALYINETKIGYARTGGFDTHGEQAQRLDELLSELNAALVSFIASMKARGLWDRTIIYITSEFGRTIGENGNGGTDHGGAVDGIVISPLSRGGEFGSYQAADFVSDSNYIQPQINVATVISEMVRTLGFDPSPIIPDATGSLGLFG
jgi:uncharacterized protein (DUF1501 family)